MPRYLLQLAQVHDQFRLPELESLARLYNIDLAFDRNSYADDSPFLFIELENDSQAKKLIERSILAKAIYEPWACQDNYAALHEEIKAHPERWPMYKTTSFKFSVTVFGGTLPQEDQLDIINSFAYLPFEGKIDLKNPQVEFVVIADYGLDFTRNNLPEVPQKVYMGRLVAHSNRDIVNRYDLKKRRYLSNTSMDAELSLIMANQALAAPGKLIYDPFVGSGSFLYTCSHFGAYTMGSDIDGRQFRGRDGKSVNTNIEQYGLHGKVLDVLTLDIKHHAWRRTPLFDGIVTAPYGVRAGAKQLGRKNGQVRPIHMVDGKPAHLQENYYPPTRPYEMDDVIRDLHEFAAQNLVLGGRLVYWLPTITDEYEPKDIPEHPCLTVIANSEQSFGLWSRRLITLEKTRSYNFVEEEDTDNPSNEHVPAHSKFRTRYFQPNDDHVVDE
ncbi:hypothetical protein BDF22DRAFT_674429 [Syncephalis plumigaleata]|nr:hypothetical protein BDF22DRAFT_674429 [Syncephalis plumigaleata]